MIGSTQGRIQLQRGKPVVATPAPKAGRSVQGAAAVSSANPGGSVTANGTGEHRIVSALGRAADATVSHNATSAPQSATYAAPHGRVRKDAPAQAPGAAQFALRETIGAVGAAADEQREPPVKEVEHQAQAERPPDRDLVERHRERAVQRLEDLDDRARSEASEAGSTSPAYEFQVGPDARAYRVGFREPAPSQEQADHPERNDADSRPTVGRQ